MLYKLTDIVTKNLGIYKILNLSTGKFYIGSTEVLNRRLKSHFNKLFENKHKNIKLQSSFNKHGLDNFRFEILELIDNKYFLLEREQYYLDTLLFASENDNRFNELGYNLCRVAGRTIGVKLSKESMAKKIASTNITNAKPETKLKRSKAQKNRPPTSDSTRLKFSEIRKGKSHNWGDKISKSRLNNPKILGQPSNRKISVVQINKNTGEILKIYESMTEAGLLTNIKIAQICYVCLNKKNYKTAGGYKWEYGN